MPQDLQANEIGTREYWDTVYERELQISAEQPTDEDSIWFADADAESKIILWLDDQAAKRILYRTARARRVAADDGDANDNGSDDGHSSRQITEEGGSSFLDLGTGNGHLLFAMRDAGWEGRMVGVDYSGSGVELARRNNEARRVLRGEEEDDDKLAVQFELYDLMRSNLEPPGLCVEGGGFDVILDKGTFDAISLSPDLLPSGKRVYQQYREKVEVLVKLDGRLLITSCNWTEPELRHWLEGSKLEFETALEYPTFEFAGKTGQKIVSLVFRRIR